MENFVLNLEYGVIFKHQGEITLYDEKITCLCFRIGRRPVLFLGVIALVVGRCVSVFTASIYSVFLLANFVANLPVAVVFQSPLIIGE
jgi:hypothetical protein